LAAGLPFRGVTPVRAVGALSLTAIAMNGMIGAGIFALPANVAQLAGLGSPLVYIVAGTATLLIALCFAEAASLFDSSGGPYLYVKAAFGPFPGFQAGWMFVLTRATAVAAISNTFAAYLGFFFPAAGHGVGRLATVTVLIGALAAINARGIRQGVWAINILTAGKLIPLLVLCGVGLFFLDTRAFSFTTVPPLGSLQQACLLLFFALGGFEVATVPSEEVISPRRTVPVALISGVTLVVLLYLLIQVVAMGTLPALAGSATPLASAAARFLGTGGGLLLTIGAILSTTGTDSSSILASSRMLYALARGGQLPAPLGELHARYRTPVAAILVFSAVSWGLAISGTFVQLAAVSALARLLFYAATSLAIPVLRRKMPDGERRFTLPGGPLIPLLAAALCVWLIVGSSLSQVLMLAAAAALGTVLYYAGSRATSARS
jgi:basic amino acid/polyamine antiporter, APA family